MRKATLESTAIRWWKKQNDLEVESLGTLEYDVIGNHNYSVPLIPGDEGKTLASMKCLSVSCLLFNVEGLGHFQVNALPWIARKENFNATAVQQVLLWIAKEGLSRSPPLALPRTLWSHSDGGDGNWSWVTLAFHGCIVLFGVVEESNFGRFDPGHGHVLIDGIGSVWMRYVRGVKPKGRAGRGFAAARGRPVLTVEELLDGQAEAYNAKSRRMLGGSNKLLAATCARARARCCVALLHSHQIN